MNEIWGRITAVWPSLWLVVITLAMGGCTQVPVPQASAPPLPAGWRNATTAPPQEPRANLRSWWTAFADPQLNRLVERALQGSPGLEAARDRIQASAYLLDAHRQRFKPTVEAATHNAQPPNSRDAYFQFGVDANWELGLFGRKNADIRLAKGLMREQQSRAVAARVALVSQVASRYLQLQNAREESTLVAALVKRDQHWCSLMRTRLAAKLADPVAVAQAQGELADDRARLIDLQRRIRQLQQALAVALGEDEPNPAWFAESGLPSLHQAVRTLPPADLLRLRPDIVEAQARVEQAVGRLGVAHADRFPRVSLEAGLMWTTDITRRSGGDTDFRSAPIIGPEISIPLFDWGRRLAAERARASQLRAALQDYRQTVLSAVGDVEDAFASLNASRRILAERQRTLTAQNEVLKTRRKLAGLGLISPLEVLKGQREQLRARIRLSRANLNHDQSFVNLYQAYGGPALSAVEGG